MTDVPVLVAAVVEGASERARALADAGAAAGFRALPCRPHEDSILYGTHDPAMLAHLSAPHRTDGDAPAPAGDPATPASPAPGVFPIPGLMGGLPPRAPASAAARAGWYRYDTATPLRGDTWARARAAVDMAATAADLVVAGERIAYAPCEPAGSHAARAAYGGGCYLNNAAVAAGVLRTGGADRIAVIDIDLYHGNGTQSIFYDDADVYFGSVHIDPGSGWFPYYLGFSDETGRGSGAGANRNVPLAPGTGDPGWLAGLAWICAEVTAFGAGAVVLSLGVGAAAGDPAGALAVTRTGFVTAGRFVRDLGLPVVAVQEGGYGYHPPTAARLTGAVLDGLAGRALLDAVD